MLARDVGVEEGQEVGEEGRERQGLGVVGREVPLDGVEVEYDGEMRGEVHERRRARI